MRLLCKFDAVSATLSVEANARVQARSIEDQGEVCWENRTKSGHRIFRIILTAVKKVTQHSKSKCSGSERDHEKY